MIKITRLTLAGILLIAGFLFFGSNTANANGTHDAPAADAEPAQSAQYEYEVSKSSSLSLLARRSLQLYDQENNDLTLSEAQIIFAETAIVNKIGARLLEVGERVKIDRALVEDFAKQSQSLSADKIALWQKYADSANFKLDDINPVSGTSAKSDPKPAESDQAAKADNQEKAEASTKNPTPWYWWLIGAATLGILYYLLSGPRTPTKK